MSQQADARREFKVVEDAATTNYLVLPATEELSDADLESVAGGLIGLRMLVSDRSQMAADTQKEILKKQQEAAESQREFGDVLNFFGFDSGDDMQPWETQLG